MLVQALLKKGVKSISKSAIEIFYFPTLGYTICLWIPGYVITTVTLLASVQN